MISPDPRRRRLVPCLAGLESRRLLSFTVTSAVQNGTDFVGPNASQGSDGIQDLVISLSNLTTTVNYIVVQGPSGFEWQTQPDGSGYSFAEFSQSGSTGTLYINPQVNSTQTQQTGTLPLGGSTGSFVDLATGDSLTVKVYYDSGAPETAPFTLSSSGSYALISATLPVSEPPSPGNTSSSIQVADDNQDDSFTTDGHGSWPLGQNGLVHLVVTVPSSLGIDFKSESTWFYGPDQATQNGLVFSLSDNARQYWDSTVDSYFHNHLIAFYNNSNENQVDLYFAPTRDEFAANGYTSTSMTLQVQLPAPYNSTIYVSSVPVTQDWNLTKLTNPPTPTPTPVPTATSAVTLQNYLTAGDGIIDLQAGQTIVCSQPISITHSVTIVGNNATLEFAQNGTAWSYTATGAIYVPTLGEQNVDITLEDFTIEFASTPLIWDTPPGSSVATFDPNNDVAGMNLAVVNDSGYAMGSYFAGQENYTTDAVSLAGMTIYGPPAFNANSSTENYEYLEGQNPDYIGEPDIPLVLTNNTDFGAITNSTLQGGPLALSGGPWTIAGNTYLGATGGTYATAFVSAHSIHDLLVQGNSVTQSASTGYLLRFTDFTSGSTNTTVEDNVVGGGNFGYLKPEDQYFNGQFTSTAGVGPELMLQESGGSVLFQGRPAWVASGGTLLVLPNVRATTYTFGNQYFEPSGLGEVVSIVGDVNANGTPNNSLAGEWFVVAQEVSNADGSLTLLMQTPMPPLPSSGYYIVEVTDGFVGNNYIDNTINANNSSNNNSSASVDMDLGTGGNFGTRVIGNHFTGGGGVQDNQTGAAILVGSWSTVNSASGTLLPPNWTYIPDLGIIVEDNIIEDSLGGIEVGSWHGDSYLGTLGSLTTSGRVYVSATVIGNVFEDDANWLAWVAGQYSSAWYNSPTDSGVPSGAPANEIPPTLTVGYGWAPGAPNTAGDPPLRYPSTVGNVIGIGTSTPAGPQFIDPNENVVEVQGNYAVQISSGGVVTAMAEPTGQVYDGIVNGSEVASALAPETNNVQNEWFYSGYPYYPFNVNNPNLANNPDSRNQLNIADVPANSQGVQALVIGQDDYDLVGGSSGSSSPDGIADLHILLTGLSAVSSVIGLQITDPTTGETWTWPETGSSPQIVVDHSAGSTTADVFIEPTTGHAGDTFTISLTYASGGPITVPLQGVIFSPSLTVEQPSLLAPLNVSVSSTTSSSISLSWVAAPGATEYVVYRETPCHGGECGDHIQFIPGVRVDEPVERGHIRPRPG